MNFVADHIRSMQGYTYGEQPHDRSAMKLNTNENPYPPTPKIQAALAALDLEALRRYPDATATALREAIAARHHVSSNQVLVTNGGDEAIRLVATACVSPNTPLISTVPGYSLYPVIAAVLNARFIPMELGEDFRPDAEAGRRSVAQRARLVCIPNPNAPSGVLLSTQEIDAFAARFRGPLLIDEAYVDFVSPDRAHDLVPLLAHHRNLLLLRTFSKGFSMAGARVGYLLGDAALIEEISVKVRDSYNVNSVSQIMALAALDDLEHAQKSWDAVRSERMRVNDALCEMGYAVPQSEANFVLPQRTDRGSFAQVYETLRNANIFVRYFPTERLYDRIRVTIGNRAQNDALLDALTELT